MGTVLKHLLEIKRNQQPQLLLNYQDISINMKAAILFAVIVFVTIPSTVPAGRLLVAEVFGPEIPIKEGDGSGAVESRASAGLKRSGDTMNRFYKNLFPYGYFGPLSSGAVHSSALRSDMENEALR